MYELAETIRARRKELGLTLEELAERVGVTPGALSHVESGRRFPDPRNAVAIAQALELEPDDVLTLLDEAHAERRAAQVGRRGPSERSLDSAAPSRASVRSASPVFRAMPIDAMFARPAHPSARASSPVPAAAPAPVGHADDSLYGSDALLDASLAPGHDAVGTPRDRARFASSSDERLRAAEELADDASRAIRTLRGMLDDDDPLLAREARRLLRELDVRGADE